MSIGHVIVVESLVPHTAIESKADHADPLFELKFSISTEDVKYDTV